MKRPGKKRWERREKSCVVYWSFGFWVNLAKKEKKNGWNLDDGREQCNDIESNLIMNGIIITVLEKHKKKDCLSVDAIIILNWALLSENVCLCWAGKRKFKMKKKKRKKRIYVECSMWTLWILEDLWSHDDW